MRRSGCCGITLVLALLLARNASAGGIDTYDAPVSGADLLQTARAHAEQGDAEPFGRLSLAYDKDPVVMRLGDGTETHLVHHQLGMHGAVGLALWRRFQVALVLPVYLQSGEAWAGRETAEGVTVGDGALDVRFALLRRDDLVELAFTSRIAVPTGDEERFVGDGQSGATLGALVSRQFGKEGVLLTSSLSASLRDRAATAGDDGGSAVLLALGAAVPVGGRWSLTGEGALSTELSEFLASTSTPASLLGGVRYGFSGWTTHIGAGPGLTQGMGTPDLRVVAMVGTEMAPSGDEASEPAPVGPIGVQDRDHDGIDDARDACDQQPEDKDEFEDDDGCPDKDDDADGIADDVDRCRSQAEDKDGFADADGCPETDNDADDIADAADACPAEAEDKDGFSDEDGCPDADNDADGVLDASDLCPIEKESPNGVQDEDGCPDLLRVDQEQIRTLEPIYFERGSDKLQDRSLPLVKELAQVIAGRPDLGVISIEGHTDSAGAERSNLQLSQKRAEAIKRILIENGVPAERLIATGFGEMRPIASNEGAAGREQNRRVEFRLAGMPSAQ